MENQEKLGEDIRVQGDPDSGKMTELVYNQSTGEFVTKSEGSTLAPEETNVTEMTREGFASGANEMDSM